MAESTKVKRVNVGGTVTPDLHEFLEEYRWTHRMSKSDVINAALLAWAKGEGFEPAETGEAAAPAEAEAPADETAKPRARRAS